MVTKSGHKPNRLQQEEGVAEQLHQDKAQKQAAKEAPSDPSPRHPALTSSSTWQEFGGVPRKLSVLKRLATITSLFGKSPSPPKDSAEPKIRKPRHFLLLLFFLE